MPEAGTVLDKAISKIKQKGVNKKLRSLSTEAAQKGKALEKTKASLASQKINASARQEKAVGKEIVKRLEQTKRLKKEKQETEGKEIAKRVEQQKRLTQERREAVGRVTKKYQDKEARRKARIAAKKQAKLDEAERKKNCLANALANLSQFTENDLHEYVNNVLSKAREYDKLGNRGAINKAIDEVNQENLQNHLEDIQVTANNVRKFDNLAKTLKEKPINLRSLLVQRYTNLSSNVEAYQKAAQQRLFKALYQGMSDEELSYLQNKDNDISVARALDGKTAPELAKQLAKKIENYIDVRNPELIISNALRLREVNTDRFIRAVHDQRLVMQGGRSMAKRLSLHNLSAEMRSESIKNAEKRWVSFIKTHLNLEKTFAGSKAIDTEGNLIESEVDKRLQTIYDNITTGKSEIFTRSTIVNDREAVKRKAHLFFYWKDHESFLNYSREYGQGNLFKAINGDLNSSGNRIGTAELMGDNPASVYLDLKKIQRKKSPKSQAWNDNTDMLYKEVMQQNKAVVSPSIAAFGSNTRALSAAARLSTIVLQSLPDSVYIASFAQRWGNQYFQSFASTISHTFDSFADDERKFIAKQFKLLADSHLGYIARFADLTNGTELIQKVTTGFFRANLLEAFDKGNRHSLMHLISKGLYKQRNKSWNQLLPETRWQLQKYDLGEKEWDLLRTKNQEGLFTTANVDVVTDDELKTLYGDTKPRYEMRNDLYRKVYTIFSVASDNAVLAPDSFMKAFMYFGTRPGTVKGELFRMVMQFKGFAFTYADKVLWQGFQDAMNTQMRLRWGLAMFAATLPLSYMSNLFNNLSHGKSMPLFSKMNVPEKINYLADLVNPNFGVFMQILDPTYKGSGELMKLFTSPSFKLLLDTISLGGAIVTANPKKSGKEIKNIAKNILPIDTMPVIGPYLNQLLGDKSYLAPGQKMIYGK
ncbi:hypothetical protein [Rickettsiella massiliensis]|uniref:hypothetical protein n=1 Tax=Rickettsiella massiliensis TaxID=676517 RepID=UPI00029B4ABC|nr:hypothetical protein [Rickettsiella massiliensis]